LRSASQTRILAKLTDLDYERIAKSIEKFLQGYIQNAKANGVVIGLSGGLDSAVVAALCTRALGKGNVLGIIIPSSSTPAKDIEDAQEHAKILGIKHMTVNVEPIVEKYTQAFSSIVLPEEGEEEKEELSRVARGNLVARARMSVLYYHAYLEKRLVVGTSDKSELYIGYFTKFGDGGADVVPISFLYKTQVRALGRYLGIPTAILQKKSSPHLWADHTAEDEIGISYEDVDSILYMLVDRKATAAKAASALGLQIDKVKRVETMIRKSAHKRAMPVAPTSLDVIANIAKMPRKTTMTTIMVKKKNNEKERREKRKSRTKNEKNLYK
jgi:NAD+ synthase